MLRCSGGVQSGCKDKPILEIYSPVLSGIMKCFLSSGAAPY